MSETRQVDRPDPTTEPAQEAGGRRAVRLALRLIELVVVISLGMFVLGGALHAILGAVGLAYPPESFAVFAILEMGVTMAVPAAAWMRFRRHGWASTLEMVGAMMVPTLVVLVPVALGALDGEGGLILQHVLLLGLMVVVVVRHRREFSTPAVAVRTRRSALRTAGLALAYVAAFAALPVLVGLANAQAYEASRYGQPAATFADAPVPAHDPAKQTAVIVVGNSGANVADTLVPYEVLATTEAFNVYVVAPERRPVALLGGLDLVPDLSFAQLAERLNGAAPDVTIVPEMPESDESDAQVTAWLRDYASDGLLVSVCTGARVLAESGLLDGHEATSHWYRLAKLEREHPAVEWRRGTRYVDDGEVITTGGLLSSIDGSLRVVERLVDDATAAKAAEAVGWRHYSPSKPAPLPVAKLAPENAVMHLLGLGFRANGTTVGVVVADGVGELELAAAFDPYPEAKAARTLAIAAGNSIRSRHGLTFVPRAQLATVAGGVDRLLVPGTAEREPAVTALGVPATYLHERPGFAFDPALREIASTMDLPTARWAAKILEYPAAGLGLTGAAWPWTLTLTPVFLGLTGMALLAGVLVLVRRARRRS